MKVKTKGKTEITISYPCLGIFPNKAIVLFHSPSKGICIESGETSYKIGHYAEDWVDDWELYDKEVVLSND